MKKIITTAVCLLLCLVMAAAYIPCASAAQVTQFYDRAEMVEICSHIEKDAGMGKEGTVQGACSDGKYAYFAVLGRETVILKYEIATWKLVKKQAVAGIGHANDITYNSKEKCLLIANNYPDYNLVSILDPKTLEVTKTVTLKVNIYSIAYIAKIDRYVVGISGGYQFAFLDAKFKVKKKFKGVETGYTRQGCDCDENYIYFVQSGAGNVIVVYDYSGKQVDMIPMGNTYEAENLFHVGKSFYTTLHYYGNYVQRIGLSDDTMIRYTVHYDPGSGTGKMKDTVVHYAHNTPLRACTFTRPGYFFGGWRISRELDGKYRGYQELSDEAEWLDEKKIYEYDLYPDQAKVSKTTKIGDVTLTAFWISELYNINYTSDGATGWMDTVSVRYGEDYVLPENTFVKEGYVFSGYTAQRSYDDRTYGYRKDSDRAEWLDEDDLYKAHVFMPGDTVRRMTYEGLVTFTAKFRFAYTFDDDGSALLEYIGVDTVADIPKPSDHFTRIATGAFHDNDIMTEIHVPEGVTTIEKDAVSNCTVLQSIYFDGYFPEDFDVECISGSGQPMLYVEHEGQMFFVGMYADRYNAALIRDHAAALNRAFAEGRYDSPDETAEAPDAPTEM